MHVREAEGAEGAEEAEEAEEAEGGGRGFQCGLVSAAVLAETNIFFV